MVAAVLASAVVFGASGAFAESNGGQGAVEAPKKEPAVIDGFRSATFGMSESEVKKAIKADFGVSDPTKASNDVERTTILAVAGKTLMPDTPPATISYILGASSAKLIQVNVVWGENGGADVRPVSATAKALVSYFLGKGSYAKDSVIVNQTLPNGSVLAFRGADAKGHMVVMNFFPIAEGKDAKAGAKADGDKAPQVTKAMLRLSYVASPGNPDVFHIDKGQF